MHVPHARALLLPFPLVRPCSHALTRFCYRLSPPAGQGLSALSLRGTIPSSSQGAPEWKGVSLVPGKRDSQKGRLLLTASCSLHKPSPSCVELSRAGRRGPSSSQPGPLAFRTRPSLASGQHRVHPARDPSR